MEAIKQVNRPIITIAHILTTFGLMGGLLASINATENKVERNEARQEMVIKNQDEIKKDFKTYQHKQEVMQQQQMQLLYEIKGKLENQ